MEKYSVVGLLSNRPALSILKALYESGGEVRYSYIRSQLRKKFTRGSSKTTIQNYLKIFVQKGLATKKGRYYKITGYGINIYEGLTLTTPLILDPRICQLMAELTTASNVYGAQAPPSALMMKVKVDYKIRQNGYFNSNHEVSFLQLLKKQGIPTPVLCDPTSDPRISWNERRINVKNHLERHIFRDPSQFFENQVNQVFYLGGTITPELGYDFYVGGLNSLSMSIGSRLQICKMKAKDTYAFCQPVFYGVDSTDIHIKVPDNVKVKAAVVYGRTMKDSSWTDSWARVDFWEDGKKRFDNKSIDLYYEGLSMTQLRNLALPKRFAPDLLNVKIGCDNKSFVNGCAVYSQRYKKDLQFEHKLRRVHSLTYLCNNHTCPWESVSTI